MVGLWSLRYALWSCGAPTLGNAEVGRDVGLLSHAEFPVISWRCKGIAKEIALKPNQPDQERTSAYRDSAGPNSRSHAQCATFSAIGKSRLGNSGLEVS